VLIQHFSLQNFGLIVHSQGVYLI